MKLIFAQNSTKELNILIKIIGISIYFYVYHYDYLLFFLFLLINSRNTSRTPQFPAIRNTSGLVFGFKTSGFCSITGQADAVGSPEFIVGNEGKLNYLDEACFEINKAFHIFISLYNESLQKIS
jgi:hypothetical protein